MKIIRPSPWNTRRGTQLLVTHAWNTLIRTGAGAWKVGHYPVRPWLGSLMPEDRQRVDNPWRR